jgi:esterase/lipase superfamily enzyme
MHREYRKWFSPQMGREMEMLIFGHAGLPTIVFPTSCGRFYDFEDNGMVASLAHRIADGHLRLYCVDSVDGESWYNRGIHGVVKIARHKQYEQYILQEVVRLVRDRSRDTRLVAVGCSFGGYHAINIALRHPDIFTGCLSMSGSFEVSNFLRGHYDTESYFHVPLHYMANMNDPWYIERYRRNTLVLATAEYDQCWNDNERLSAILRGKNIPHRMDVWAQPYGHDWPTWNRMVQVYL